MKNLIISLALVAIATSAFAQKIVVDKTYSDNSRGIICNSEVCRSFTDRVVASLALSLVTDQKEISNYNLSISFLEAAAVNDEFSIPDNATLLIRTADNTVLQLKCGKGGEDYFGDLVKVGNTLVNMKSVSAVAPITADDIAHLSTGIIKIRCELKSSQLEKEYYENNFKKAKIGSYFSAAKKILDKAAATKTSGNINDGF